NPYRGLRPFEAEQRGLFFGRGVEVGAIVDRLRLEPFVLVTGESGVGKSSLLRAGVLPAIREGALAGGRTWRVAQLVPGARPMTALREALGAELDLSGGDVGRELSRRLGADQGVLIFVDQLEELLGVSEPAERALMETTLARLADGAAGVRVL